MTQRSTDVPNRLDQSQVGGDHYAKHKLTPWQVLEAILPPAEFRGYLKGDAVVYILREGDKAGPVDISKARHTLQKLEEYDAKLAALAEMAVLRKRAVDTALASTPSKARIRPAKRRKAVR